MRSLFATLRQLVIPAGAGASAPATVIGPDVPPELAARYAPGRVISAVIFRRGPMDYVYLAQVVPTIGPMFVAVGGIEGVGLTLTEGLRWVARPGPASTDPTQTHIAAAFADALTVADSLTVDAGATWTIDGVSAPRTSVLWAGSQSNTAALGAGFTVVLSATATFRPTRAYQLTIGGFVVCSTSANVAEFAVNIDYGGGDIALWYPGAFGPSGAAAGIATNASTVIANTTGSAKTGIVRVYLRSSGGGTVQWRGVNPLSSAGNLRFVEAHDIGAAASFPGAIALP